MNKIAYILIPLLVLNAQGMKRKAGQEMPLQACSNPSFLNQLPLDVQLMILEHYFSDAKEIQTFKAKIRKLKHLNKTTYHFIMCSPAFYQFIVDKMAYTLRLNEDNISQCLKLPSKAFCLEWLDKCRLRNEFNAVLSIFDTKAAYTKLPQILINQKDASGNTPLLSVINTMNSWGMYLEEDLVDFTNLMKELLILKANPNICNKYGDFPLNQAVRFGEWTTDATLVTILLDHNANVNVQDAYGDTALMTSIELNYNNFKALLDRKTNILIQNKKGQTALMLACQNINIYTEEIKDLLEAGADVVAKDNQGMTALMHACQNSEEVEDIQPYIILLSYSAATINYQNNLGQTALMLAAQHDKWTFFPDVVNILLKNGAERNLKDNKGRTALDIAKEYGNEVAQEILKNNNK